MAYLNSVLWKSAYLLEFYQSDTLEEAFTFSVPPQSEEFTYPQRVNETKTFGGSVFEDYGNDTIQISLAGTTINQQSKFIYRGTRKSPKYLSGEDEIFYLKDILETYGNFNKLTNKKVYLYSLESGKTNTSTNHKCWRIWIQDLSIRRNKDKPFCYDYTLKAFGIPYDQESGSFIGKVGKTIKEWMQKVNDSIDNLNEIFGNITNSVLEWVSEIKNCVSEISEIYDTLEGLATNVVIDADLIITETSEFGDEIAKTITKPVSTRINLLNACTNLIDSCKGLTEWYDGIVGTQQWSQVKDSLGIADQDFEDAVKSLVNSTNDSANKINSMANQKASENNSVIAVVPGSDGEEDELVTFNGFKEYSYKTGDTWASIAYQAYGSTDYAAMLQLFNSDVSLDDLTAGTVIYIPSSDSVTTTENNVYIIGEQKDAFGKDILIENEDFSVENGDLKVSKEIETINQAIQSRLTTAINSRVRNVIYGIRNEAGIVENEAEACSTYITTSITRTILADPRIDSVESLSWEGNGEHINVKVTYKTILGSTKYYDGAI